MRFKFILTSLLITACLVLPSLSYGADGPVKVGDITAFTGEVLARTKGVWVKVKSAPHPVFSDDKVVTRRGRAEIGFVDGGVMRLNLDSNISVEQINAEEGFAFKNKVSTRQVNLLVGEVWFSVKMENGNQLNVRTPTMTAAVRGSSATITQGPNASKPAKYAFIEGHIETNGSFEKAPPKAIEWDHVRTDAADLPSSDPEIDNSEAQRAAVEATEARSKASQAASRAGEEDEVAKAAGDQATKSQSNTDKLDAAKQKAKANAVKGDAALLTKQADIISEQERLSEAQAFKETKKINDVQNNIGKFSKDIANLEVVKKKLEDIENDVAKAVEEGDLNKAEKALKKSEGLVKNLPKLSPLPTALSGENEDAADETAEESAEELGYEETAEEPGVTAPATTELPPDTQDLGTSSPAQ